MARIGRTIARLAFDFYTVLRGCAFVPAAAKLWVGGTIHVSADRLVAPWSVVADQCSRKEARLKKI